MILVLLQKLTKSPTQSWRHIKIRKAFLPMTNRVYIKYKTLNQTSITVRLWLFIAKVWSCDRFFRNIWWLDHILKYWKLAWAIMIGILCFLRYFHVYLLLHFRFSYLQSPREHINNVSLQVRFKNIDCSLVPRIRLYIKLKI